MEAGSQLGAWMKESGLENTRAVSKGKGTQVQASGKCICWIRPQIPGEVDKSASGGISRFSALL